MPQSSHNYAQNPEKRGSFAKRNLEQSRTEYVHKKPPMKRDEWKFAADRYKLSSVRQKNNESGKNPMFVVGVKKHPHA
jgi:hypothetical protein